MSIENLMEFLKMIEGQEDAANIIKKLSEKNEDEIIAYARQMGYEFDKQDLTELRRKVLELNKARLKRNLKKASASVTVKEEQRPGMRNLNNFVQLVGEDAAIAQKVQEISSSDPGALFAYAKELGYEFDENDLKEFGGKMLEQSDELSDEELEQVAGGDPSLSAVVLAAAVVVVFFIGALVTAVAGEQ